MMIYIGVMYGNLKFEKRKTIIFYFLHYFAKKKYFVHVCFFFFKLHVCLFMFVFLKNKKECNTISIQTPLNWTCYFDSSESNPKFHLYPTNAQKNAVFPTTLATCVFGLVFFSVCLCACRLTRKALKLRTNTRFYSPPVFDRNKHLHKKKRKQRKITFEAKVAMNLILRFSRVLLANDEIEKRKNQTKKLLIHVIIRTVCQNIGKLNAISISDIIDYGSNKLSLVSSGQSEKQLFQNFILDLIEEPFQKLKLKTSNNSVVALDIGYYADEGGEKHEERKGKKEEEENSDSESSESDV